MVINANVQYVVCMFIAHITYGHHNIYQSMNQPGKVANPVLGQLNRENEYSPFPVVRP